MKYVIAAFALLLVAPFQARALGPSFSYEGRAFDASGNPLTSAAVSFRVSIRPPGYDNCVMYSEIRTLDLSTTNGFFTLAVNGAGSVSQAYSSASPAFEKVFSNAAPFNFSAADCGGTAESYTPNPGDGRNLKVEISTDGGASYEALPLIAIGSVPYAISAQQIAGYGPSQLLRVGAGVSGTTELTQAMLTELNALLAGASTKYAASSSSQGTIITPSAIQPSSIAAGSLWYDTTNSELKLYNGTTSVSLSTGGSGLTALTGDVMATGPGSAAATVASVGGVMAFNVASGANAANAATDTNTPSTIVKRDATGGFSAGSIAATAVNASGPVAAASVLVGSISLSSSSLNMNNLPITNVGRVLTSAGSAVSPAYALAGNGGLFQPTSGNIGFATTNVERMRIEANGYVGIGTTSPTAVFNVYGTSGSPVKIQSPSAPKISFNDTSGALVGGIGSETANPLILYGASGYSNFVVSAMGKVGIGTTSPANVVDAVSYDTNATISVQNSSSTMPRYPSVSVRNYAGGVGGYPRIVLTNSEGTDVAPSALPGAAEIGGFETYGSYDTTANTSAGAAIKVITEGSWAPGNTPSSLNIMTGMNGTLSPRLTVVSNGNVGIGTSTPMERLMVAGNIAATGQIVGGPGENTGGTAANFTYGNSTVLTSPSGNAITLQSMRTGGVYRLAIVSAVAQTYTFTDLGGVCSTMKFSPNNGSVGIGQEALYVITPMPNNTCYIQWSTY